MHIAYVREFTAPARYWDSYSVFYVIFSDVTTKYAFEETSKQAIK
jgi:hypothetical protein